MTKVALLEHTKDLLLKEQSNGWFKKLNVSLRDVLLEFRDLINESKWTITSKSPESQCADEDRLIYKLDISNKGHRVTSNENTTPKDVASWYLWRVHKSYGLHVLSARGNDVSYLYIDIVNRDLDLYYTNEKSGEPGDVYYTSMRINLNTGKVDYVYSEESTGYSYC